MAEAWEGNTFRIFPGKYGEDPVWGLGLDNRYADGKNADEVFKSPSENFFEPKMPRLANLACMMPFGLKLFTKTQKINQGRHFLVFIIMKITPKPSLAIQKLEKGINTTNGHRV